MKVSRARFFLNSEISVRWFENSWFEHSPGEGHLAEDNPPRSLGRRMISSRARAREFVLYRESLANATFLYATWSV